jgi:hypothetical protein
VPEEVSKQMQILTGVNLMSNSLPELIRRIAGFFPNALILEPAKLPKRIPKEDKLIETTPAKLKELYALVNGSKERNGLVLPVRKASAWMRLVPWNDSVQRRSVRSGYESFYKNRTRPIVDCDEALPSLLWSVDWWTIAYQKYDSEESVFFDAKSGAVFFERWVRTCSPQTIHRSKIAESLEDFFEQAIQLIETEGVDWCRSKGGKVEKKNLDWATVFKAWQSKIHSSSFLREAPALSSQVPKLACKVPPELLESYEICSGWAFPLKGYDEIRVLGVDELLENNNRTDESDEQDDDESIFVSESKSDAVKPHYYSKKRLTFAVSDYHRFQVDFEPTARGVKGQIVVADYEAESIDVFCASIAEFFEIATHALANNDEST